MDLFVVIPTRLKNDNRNTAILDLLESRQRVLRVHTAIHIRHFEFSLVLCCRTELDTSNVQIRIL